MMLTSEANHKTIIIDENFVVEQASLLREETKKYMADGTYNYTLDFKNCKFIDSTGLGVIVSIYKKCMENKGSLKLKHLNDDVLRVFKLTRLDKVFDIE